MASEIVNTSIMEPGSNNTEEPIKLNVSGRTVYAAIKNLLVHHYKLTPDELVARIMSGVHVPTLIQRYLDGDNIRTWISKLCRETVERIAPQLIREEVRAMVNGKVKITIGEG